MFLLEEVREKDSRERWNPEFMMMKLETTQQVENKTMKAAKDPQNRSLNRYRDVLPYDDTRVQLKTGNNDYINANYVELKEIKRKYILAQGPLQNTSGDFWRMIWENNSSSIVMLCRIVEKQMIKCHPYWPMGEDEVVEFSSFEIKNNQTVMEEHYVIRDLTLTYIPTGEKRSIKQYHFLTWPDFGVPEDSSSFVEFLDILRSNNIFKNDQPPVIHCSAGIGRSGTLVLVDAALKLCEDKNSPNSLDIGKILLSLRQHRIGLVQTPQQYRFSYLAIITGLHRLFPSLFTEVTREGEGDLSSPPELPEKSKTNRAPPSKPPRANNISTPEEDARKFKQISELESSEGSEEDEIIDLSEDDEETEEIEDSDEDNEYGDEDDECIGPRSVEPANFGESDDDDVNDNEEYAQLKFTEEDDVTNKEDYQALTTTTETSENLTAAVNDDVNVSSALENTDDVIGAKAKENEVRHRQRAEKKEATQDLISNIKQRMKDSEKERNFYENKTLLYVGVAIVVTSCFILAYKSLS